MTFYRKKRKLREMNRYFRRLEIERIHAEAYHDMGFGEHPSIGEVDALTESVVLGIGPAEVLRDPKIRYVHPALRS